jgi:hypothetical protein
MGGLGEGDDERRTTTIVLLAWLIGVAPTMTQGLIFQYIEQQKAPE